MIRLRVPGSRQLYYRFSLVAEFIGPPKVYTFGFFVGSIIPKSVKCIHSANETKPLNR